MVERIGRWSHDQNHRVTIGSLTTLVIDKSQRFARFYIGIHWKHLIFAALLFWRVLIWKSIKDLRGYLPQFCSTLMRLELAVSDSWNKRSCRCSTIVYFCPQSAFPACIWGPWQKMGSMTNQPLFFRLESMPFFRKRFWCMPRIVIFRSTPFHLATCLLKAS